MALAQAEQVRVQIAALAAPQTVALEIIKTTGDRFSASLAPDESLDPSVQGLFTRELDEALLAGRIRAAIHSLKDVPTVLAPGLRYGAFLKR
ncbi:MAG TPA: hydroxymethylbilane synthase, partial [bacterium]|nr:hydroxymethylbilane synthase [bacterium]